MKLKRHLNRFGKTIIFTLGLAISSTCHHPPKPYSRLTFQRGGEEWSIAFHEAGPADAPRALFVHGTPGRYSNWGVFLRHPPEGMEAVAIDRPGFGLSRPRRDIPSLRDQAAALEPFLVERGGQKTILVGHSLGGPIIVEAALNHPDKVGGLVIAAGSFDPALEKILFIQRLGEWGPIPWIIPRFLRNCNRELLPLKGELEALEARLGELRCPVVIVHGTKDGLVPYSNVAYMKEYFPPGVIRDEITIEGGSHFLPWRDPEAIYKAIQEVRASAFIPSKP